MCVIGAIAVLLAAGCGDDRAPPAPTGRDGGGLDAPFDAGPRVDGGPAECTAGEVVELGRGVDGATMRVAASGGPESFVVAWVDGASIVARFVPSDGPPGEPRVVTDTPIAPDAPATAWLGAEWGVLFTGDGAGGRDLFFRALAADGSPTGDVTALTEDAEDDASPAMITAPGGAIAAWVRADAPAVARISGASFSWGPVALGDADGPAHVALAPLGEGGYFAGWASPPVVRARLFGGDGAPGSSVITLAADLVAGPGIAAAGGTSGGAVVFEVATSPVRSDLRLQALLVDGTASGPPHLATEGGIEGRAPALVRFAGAWAGAWRAGSLGTHHVRLGLFAVEGEPVRQLSLGPLESGEASVALAVSSDGVLLVAWADREADSGETVVRARTVTCRS